jgi:hypothetical protein
MGIVNPIEVHPGLMRAIYRVCVQRGPRFSATPEEYVALIAPDSAVNSGANPLLSATRTVTEAISIGMLVPRGQGTKKTYKLGLAQPPNDVHPLEADAHLVRELRALIFAPQNNDKLFAPEAEHDPDAEADEKDVLALVRSCEFTRIQAWLLVRDPAVGTLSWTGDGERSVEQWQARHRLVSNASRWNNFRRWSLYLGLSRQDDKQGVYPDPTRAVLDELGEITTSGSEIPLVDLIGKLAERLPVLDGGVYRAAVLEHLGEDEDPLVTSPALALALTAAQAGGRLQLTQRDDFAGGSPTVGDAAYTHARIGTPK